ncbi:Hypothetical protein, putative [Bodo saltans]|uniref:Uncharacterized protein n=1 Tax=Bodo saltans TaxID=75058 RepID=A0A0S4IPP5_BODSA|nr:Hypothetical protein, putative [Bodo saltans]|eukprot:CUF11360.1 Hypothetical protein, putative [Bodo saltans]
MQEAASSSHLVRWPTSLCDVLAAHMQAVEHPVQPTYPPFGGDATGKRGSCFVVLRDIFDRLHLMHQFSSQHEKLMTEMVFTFIIELMEDSCSKNFLKPREREKFKAASAKKHPTHAAAKRKRKDDDVAVHSVTDVKEHFSSHLPSDYLLRFLAALPLLVDTFMNFCGGGVETSLLGALWGRVELVLKDLEDGSDVFYSPSQDYQP